MLLRNVALSEFRGKVYANSREGQTRIELLFRHDEGLRRGRTHEPLRSRYSCKQLYRYKDEGEIDSVLLKTARVFRWLTNFIRFPVDCDTTFGRKRKASEESGSRDWIVKKSKVGENDLPLDTP